MKHLLTLTLSAAALLCVGTLHASAASPRKGRPVSVEGETIVERPETSGVYRRLPVRTPRKERTATPAQRAAVAKLDLRGHLYYSKAWENGSQYNPVFGFYSIPLNAPSPLVCLGQMQHEVQCGYDTGEGTFYGFQVTTDATGRLPEYYVVEYDTDSWTPTKVTKMGDNSLQATDLAMDPTTGKVYGCMAGSGRMVWCETDYSTRTRTEIAELADPLYAVGCTRDGQFYGIGFSGMLYKVNKLTGALEDIGDTALWFQYTTGGCINDADNSMLVTTNNDYEAPGLWHVDLATGETTQLVKYKNGEEITCLYIHNSASAAEAPAVPKISVAAEPGSMQATVTLILPTELFNGEACTDASLDYRIEVDNETLASGTGAPGATVTEIVTLPHSGSIRFSAFAKNAAGDSPKAVATCFVGYGTPAAPKNVALSWADGKASLSWDAVTTVVQGPAPDAAAIKYKVLDANLNTVAENISGTSCSVTYPEPSDEFINLFFYVRAVNGDNESADSKSNFCPVGAFPAPLTMDLTSEENFLMHTPFDANKDNCTWRFNDGRTFYNFNPDRKTPGDDWLFSPNIRLEAGHAYNFKVTAKVSQEILPEKLEVKIGQGTTPADMTSTVVPVSTLTSVKGETLSGTILVSETGTYHIGLHCLSDAYMYRLVVDGYTIDESVNSSAPDRVSDLNVTPAANGDLSVDISFTAPAKTVGGNDITGKLTVKVTRDGESIQSISCDPGKAYSFTDHPETSGDHTYLFKVINEKGDESMETSVTVFTGVKKPYWLDGLMMWQTPDDRLKIKWDPVTMDRDKNPIPASNVTYNVFRAVIEDESLKIGEQVNKEPITATEFVMDYDFPEQQELAYMIVCPYNRDVAGTPTAVAAIVGKAYEMPVTYTDEQTCTEQLMAYSGNGTITLADDSFDQDLSAQDDDNCFFVINAQAGPTGIQTGRIHLSDKNPTVTFWQFAVAEDDNNETHVYVVRDGKSTKLLDFKHNTLPARRWEKVKVPLDEYRGETVQIRVECVSQAYLYSILDNICVSEDVLHDVSATISAPATAETGIDFNVDVTVNNLGAEQVSGYTVTLMRNGKEAATQKGDLLGAGKNRVHSFTQKLQVADGDDAEYSAVVSLAGDEDPSNDQAYPVKVLRVKNSLPTVTLLRGDNAGGSHSLSWDAIDLSRPVPVSVTEDFESGESFADEFPGWEFVDIDEGPSGVITGVEFPNHPEGNPYSFFVFDSSAKDFDETFKAHSGTKCIATLWLTDNSPIDDWAVSPLLPGNAQQISFYARNYWPTYKEAIEIWYTDHDTTDPYDFDQLESFGTLNNMTAEWQRYYANLPAGTRRFAIRSCAPMGVMLMVDDITYMEEKLRSDLTLKGYNVYLNSVKLNDAPLTGTSFSRQANEDTSLYAVTAVYDKGESEPSNVVDLSRAGLSAAEGAAPAVRAWHGHIIVSGADGLNVEIVSADGILLHSGRGNADVEAPAGIYAVRVGTRTVKLHIR